MPMPSVVAALDRIFKTNLDGQGAAATGTSTLDNGICASQVVNNRFISVLTWVGLGCLCGKADELCRGGDRSWRSDCGDHISELAPNPRCYYYCPFLLIALLDTLALCNRVVRLKN